MEDLSHQIALIKQGLLSEHDVDGLLGDLLEKQDSAAIRPLLLLLDFSEGMNHEKYSVAHAVESFPRKTYFDELISASYDMNKQCPTFMEFLLGRIMNSKKDVPLLIEAANSASPQNVSALIDALKRVRSRYASKADIVDNSEEALAFLDRL